ncbi:hypothetical protein [Catenulispora pinisilvae]|uniref:hypothetical protein n=1 Tax=Catenulispora pinisilvae TaxID=2705253 RepID=UPI0018912532|nr:hypothetical protein [Catenulispora pinisilvae]
MTGSYAAAGLLFLGLFLLGGAFSLFRQGSGSNSMRAMSLMLVLCAAMAIGGGMMRW